MQIFFNILNRDTEIMGKSLIDYLIKIIDDNHNNMNNKHNDKLIVILLNFLSVAIKNFPTNIHVFTKYQLQKLFILSIHII